MVERADPQSGVGSIASRSVQSNEDFWRVRNLLSETVPISPFGLNWDVRRWDGKYFYNPSGAWSADWIEQVTLWETGEGVLVGVVNPEGSGNAHLQVHPDYRHLEEEMIAWAEGHLSIPVNNGRERQLVLFVYEYDVQRQRLLTERSYEKMPYGGVLRHMRLGHQPLAQPTVTEGYTLRCTHPDDRTDCQRIADLLNAAFGRNFHNAEEYQMFAKLAPSFRPELDLVMETPDGSFAAYVGVPYDEANRRGIFEPVCTHPDHQRKGLALALMLEGLLRLKACGAIDVIVDTGDMIPANRLYSSIGFTEAYKSYAWRKVF